MKISTIFLISFFLIRLSYGNKIVNDECFEMYANGDYSKAVDCLNSNIISGEITDTTQLLKVYEKLGAAYVMQDRKDLGRVAFRKLFSLSPDYELDPNKYLPEIISLFLISKFEYRTSLRVVILDTLPAYPVKWNYIPFGVPQFKNKERTKGWTIIGLQSVFLFLSVFAYNKEQSYWRDRYGYPEEDVASAKKWANIHRVSFFTLSAVTLYSLVDGFLHKPLIIKQ